MQTATIVVLPEQAARNRTLCKCEEIRWRWTRPRPCRGPAADRLRRAL